MAHEKMKKKKQIKKFYQKSEFLYILGVLVLITIVGYLMSGETYFKIMKNGTEVDEIKYENLVWIGSDCINDYPDGKKYDSLGNEERRCKIIENETYLIYNEIVSKQDLTTEWLDENCECQEKICTVSYNYSQMKKATMNNSGEFISQTYNGPIGYTEGGSVIFFEPGAQVIEQCGSCQEYQCGGYNVDVWGQSK